MVMGFNLLDMSGNMVKKIRNQGVTIGDSLYMAPWMLVHEDAKRRHTEYLRRSWRGSCGDSSQLAGQVATKLYVLMIPGIPISWCSVCGFVSKYLVLSACFRSAFLVLPSVKGDMAFFWFIMT
jgi:hypothetical protein